MELARGLQIVAELTLGTMSGSSRVRPPGRQRIQLR